MKKQAPNVIRSITAHNGKLGFNWRNGKYELAVGNDGRPYPQNQFTNSAYR